jgi:putative sterol carrier protein
MAEQDATARAALGALGDADATQLAAMVGQIPDEQLAEGLAHAEGRRMILDEVFNRMADHVHPEQIAEVDAVVHFTITGAPDGGVDVYETVIRGGAVRVNKEPAEEPRVVITSAPVPFLKLVTGQQSGPAMFLTGKLKIQGDLLFASRMTSYFRIPSASG